MDSTMEGMLDTYLLETEALLDKLDEMLIADEKVGDFSTDDVNEIFRIMHTIKGSSARLPLEVPCRRNRSTSRGHGDYR